MGDGKLPGTGVRSIVIQLAKKISWAEKKLAWICGEEHLKDPIVALAKVFGMLGKIPTWGWHLVHKFVVASLVV